MLEEENQLAEKVIGAAIEVHRIVGPGLLETAYQSCLAREMALRGIPFEREVFIDLSYKGIAVEKAFRVDFVVAGRLIVELKAVAKLEENHKAQVLTYLRWSDLRLGLLINFNERLLKTGINRLIN